MDIGFIGLGIMGKHMASNLLDAGHRLRVYDIDKKAVDRLAQKGATACNGIAEATERCSIIITMLPNSPHVKEVVLGKDGIINHGLPGTLVVDMSSIAPGSSIEIEAELRTKGMRMLDAPVSGGEPKAQDGSLAIMVGGAQTDFDEARPLFDILGASAMLVGPIGSGNICKLTNNIIVALNIASLAEGLLLAQKAGADVQKVFDAIKGGLAGSTVMNAKAPMMLDGNYTPGFKIDLHIKDLNNALDTAQTSGAPLPLTAEVMQMLQAVKLDGEGQSDHSALVKYYEKIGNTKIRPLA